MGNKPIFCCYCGGLKLKASGHNNYECPINDYRRKGSPAYQRAKAALKRLRGLRP